MGKSITIFILAIILFNVSIYSQTSDELWSKSSISAKQSSKKIQRQTALTEFDVYQLNFELLKRKLVNAPQRKGIVAKNNNIISFPDGKGKLENYYVFEASIMEEELQIQYPNIRTYIGKSVNNPSSVIRFSITPLGLNALILNNPDGAIYIDPYTSDNHTYLIYNKKSLPESEPFDCGFDELNSTIEESKQGVHSKTDIVNDGKLRTFRLAVAVTGEYSQWHLNSRGVSSYESDEVKIGNVFASVVVTMLRVNAIFERDLGVSMILVDNSAKMMFLNPNTDGLTGNDKYKMIDESINVLNTYIGESNYDIGHVFAASNLGGVAYRSSVCGYYKAGGVSGMSPPEGSNFENTVTHEMGHQFGATHTFNSSSGSCNGNRTDETAVEPGSGSTIMSYAGNCSPENVTSYSERDKYFHLVSIKQMWAIISSIGSCGTSVNTGNNPPIIEAIPNYTIPISTPFALNANASDANGDELTYTWEQLDTEIAVAPPNSTSTGGPAFRSLPPNSSPTRYFPNLNTVVGGNLSNTWEVLPSVARTMTFGVTVRDNNSDGGQTNSEETTITFAGNTVPFKVTSQSSAVNWEIGSTKNITWDVGNSNTSPINCSKVNILLSTDGGYTFPIVLASNVNNDGVHQIVVPNILTNSSRIKVEAVNNIFYSLNKSNIQIINVDDDNDDDGVENDIDQCPNTRFGDKVDANGCSENETLVPNELWGVAPRSGDYKLGSIYKFDPATNNYSRMYSFKGGVDGEIPQGGIIQALNGKLYGLTRSGGAYNKGVLFEFNPANGVFMKKVDFNGGNGNWPEASLFAASNGKLYGMTYLGGLNNDGVFFEYDPINDVYLKIIDFDDKVSGRNPLDNVMEASNGKLYGTTRYGGPNGSGVIFEYDLSSKEFKALFSLGGIFAGGFDIYGGLTQASNGKLYGMTSWGGINTDGIIYEFNIETGEYSKKFDFEEETTGRRPYGSLELANNNKLYGMTSGIWNGSYSTAFLFDYDPITNAFNITWDFITEEYGQGSNSNTLLLASDGMLYVGSNGGAYGNGMIIKYSPSTNSFTKLIDVGVNDALPDSNFIEIEDYDDDNDGVINYEDLCMNTPTGEEVSATGCSESQLDDDGDGVMNNIDTCPSTPTGEVVNETGCSESQLDDDGDGVMNNIDTCPSTPTGEVVNETGCSESQLDDDGDGVMNNIDTCPDTPIGENANTTGCSQSQLDDDGDGVMNNIDTCPSTPTGEVVNETGCSESQLDDDGDGIMNNIDICPNTPTGEDVSTTGCSQSQLDDDGDGVMNNKDTCPDTPTGEDVNETGCSESQLDDDGDGIMNNIDICPNTPTGEEVSATGCSQSQLDDDGDGVMNNKDTCPDTPTGEDVNEIGCSESQIDDDLDGVMNNIDTCPDTPTGEDVNETGCSESQLDDDNDGVMNNLDLCPNSTAGVTVNENGCFFLPSNNFTFEVISETCLNKNNGQISISAAETHNYLATINGNSHNFSNNSLTVSNMESGTYEVCITVSGETYEQCFNVEISEGTSVSGKSSVSSNKVSIVITKGTAPYNVLVNGKNVLNTFSTSIEVDVKHGDLIEVKTAVLCEGIFSKNIDLFETISAYPNPTNGIFEITLPVLLNEIKIELLTSNSQLISSQIYSVINGKVQLNIENISSGVYFAKIYLENPISVKIVKI
ncbi:thrombospondin type 3 repeat-containing protein [Lutibacter sp. A64]|uniref:choice-of-anchor tandem repeat GloVer-containing protein n=1 Tax=Lutibacter sp. A64 TaxID=2918526 RepID=UPI001F0625CF|nr:choice-of-anchor tandem repeat GloVer-containing protein [Lutibacter sp. A64]UMB53728.1 thrombospondin type 3 repeat-containing protein [Lutibacter sp. A64]